MFSAVHSNFGVFGGPLLTLLERNLEFGPSKQLFPQNAPEFLILNSLSPRMRQDILISGKISQSISSTSDFELVHTRIS